MSKGTLIRAVLAVVAVVTLALAAYPLFAGVGDTLLNVAMLVAVVALCCALAVFDVRIRHSRSAGASSADLGGVPADVLFAALDEFPGPIQIKDHKGRFVLVNAFQAQQHGIPRSRWLGRTMPEVVPGEMAERAHDMDMEIVRTGKAMRQRPFTWPVAGSDSSEWLVTKVPVTDARGDVSHVIGFWLDITERVMAEKTLREVQAQLLAFLDNAPFAMAIKDTQGRYRVVNREFLRLSRAGPDGAIGKTAADFFPPGIAADVEARERDVMSLGLPMATEVSSPWPGGQEWTLAVRFPIRDAEERVTGVGAFFIDITDRKRLEEQLRQAQRMEAVGQLTGGIAHDFNNLLTVIIGNAEMLIQDLDPAVAQHGLAESIHIAARRGAELTNSLLSFARRQALSPAEIDVNALILGMDRLLRRTLGAQVEIESVLGAGLWHATADPSQLESALLNLALNSRDAMAQGGKLTIQTLNARIDEDYAETVGDIDAGQYVTIAVTDTGVGMPAEVMRRAFEPFYTTKEVGKGTGLGLSMVYGFVKQTGGHVKLYSEPGHGTTVKIYLPRADAPDARNASRQMADHPRNNGHEKILLVEDDDLVRSFVEKQLRMLGYTVVSAANGEEALRRLAEHADVVLLFTDVVMPGGMTGHKVAEEAARLRPGLRVLFTSGFTQDAMVHSRTIDPGVSMLSKPYTLRDLARKVRAAIDGT